jgi:hypothetical protein
MEKYEKQTNINKVLMGAQSLFEKARTIRKKKNMCASGE